MRFDWSQFFVLAQELFGIPRKRANREAKLRAAISRAYYAAFIRARNYLIYVDKHPIPSGVNPHEYVRVQFGRSSNKIRQEIARNLYDLRAYRNQADYVDVFPGSLTKTARNALKLTEQVMLNLGRL